MLYDFISLSQPLYHAFPQPQMTRLLKVWHRMQKENALIWSQSEAVLLKSGYSCNYINYNNNLLISKSGVVPLILGSGPHYTYKNTISLVTSNKSRSLYVYLSFLSDSPNPPIHAIHRSIKVHWKICRNYLMQSRQQGPNVISVFSISCGIYIMTNWGYFKSKRRPYPLLIQCF